MPGGSMGRFPSPNSGELPPAPNSGPAGTTSTMRGGLQLGPPGRWWDDRQFAQSIGLRKDQQKRMDAIFNANKSAILENYNSLLREESRLSAATREPQLDKARIFAAIDSVNQARAGLEKANAQMLLQVRQEMDPEQIARLEKFRDLPTPSE
jgi:Spy/CpxP family protein refolding chaperone